jgi:uncharacterized protein YjiS (DUF1127 family)
MGLGSVASRAHISIEILSARIDTVEQQRCDVLNAGSTAHALVANLMNHSYQASPAALALPTVLAHANGQQRSISTLLVRVGATPWLWYQRVGSRHDLNQLDDRLLADIGLTREQVASEHGKHFWQD